MQGPVRAVHSNPKVSELSSALQAWELDFVLNATRLLYFFFLLLFDGILFAVLE